MTFKKTKFFSLLVSSIFFLSFSAQSFPSQEEDSQISRKVIDLGKNVMNPDHLENFLDLATHGFQRDSGLDHEAEERFPEKSSPNFKEHLEALWKRIDAKSNPFARMWTSILDPLQSRTVPTRGLLATFIGTTVLHHAAEASGQAAPEMRPEDLAFSRASISSSAPPEDPYDISGEDYLYFQIGHGILKSALKSPEDEALGLQPGHSDILSALGKIYETLSNDYKKHLSSFTDDQILSYAQKGKALANAYCAFALTNKDFNIGQIYASGSAWAFCQVTSGEWTKEQKKHYFYHTLPALIEGKFTHYATLTPSDLESIERSGGGKDAYRLKISSLIGDYIHSYLSGYSGTYFSPEERTLENGKIDAQYMLRRIPSLHHALIESLYGERSTQEKETLLKESLEASRYSPLKEAFEADEETPNFNHWYWSEIVFGFLKVQEFKVSYPLLFPSNAEDTQGEGNTAS